MDWKGQGMEKDAINYLKNLVETHGTAGFEEDVQAVFRNRVKDCCDSVETDVLGSVIACRNSSASGPKILLDGHSDEIGFLVRYIDDKGYLYLAKSGGWDEEVMVSQRVYVHTADGKLPGVLGKKAIHLMDAEERKKKSEIHKLWVDIGAKSGEEAKELVEIGDFVTMNAYFEEMVGGRAAAKSFDNRAGIFCVSETLRRAKDLKAVLYGVSAVQEEIGLRGAKAAAYAVDPDVAIAIDVTHAFDIPDVDKRKGAEIALGNGPVIVRGPNINRKVFRRLVEVAKANEIPYQVAASGGGTGTDANVIQLSRSGVATGLIGLPLRYMHNPCEMLELEDLENAVKLLTAFVESVSSEDDWRPV